MSESAVLPAHAQAEMPMPPFDLKAYFQGPIRAWGLVHDWRGRVKQRFNIEMIGEWQGDVGTLTERYDYYDGSQQHRQWTFTVVPPGDPNGGPHSHYLGHSAELVGAALGMSTPGALHWRYTMNLAVGQRHFKLHFDDWMWLMRDGIAINRSKIRKWGIVVAELTVVMQKVSP